MFIKNLPTIASTPTPNGVGWFSVFRLHGAGEAWRCVQNDN